MDLLDNDVGGLSYRPVISSGPTEPIAVPYLIMPQTTIIPHPPVSSTLQSLPSTQVLSLSPSTDSKSSHSKTRDGVTNPANMEHHKKQIEEVVRFLERHEGLIDEEKMYLSKECIIRFLAAEKYDPRTTIIRLENHLAWRRKLGLYDVRAMVKEIEPEMRCGKIFTFSYAADGSPLLFMTPSKNNTEPSQRQVKNMIFVVERAVDLMGRGVNDVALILDLGGKIQRSSGSLSVMRQILSSCQSHYPERLRWCVVRNIPLLSKVLINLMWPFIDPYTKSKLIYDVPVTDNGRVDPAALPKQAGGELNFEYDCATYLPSLVELCIQRREGNKRRWQAVGGCVGSSEMEWKWALGMDDDVSGTIADS